MDTFLKTERFNIVVELESSIGWVIFIACIDGTFVIPGIFGHHWINERFCAGMMWTECKQMYGSGLRVYLLDNYNWIDFIVLSLYISSYVLRFLVEHRLRQADLYYNNATTKAHDALIRHDFHLYESIINETHHDKKSPINSYFMKACKTHFISLHILWDWTHHPFYWVKKKTK